MVRFGGKLQVVWSQGEPNAKASLHAKPISSAGVAGTTHTVVTGWSTLSEDPAPFVEGGQLKIAYGGIRSTSPSEKYSGPMAYSSSSDGVSWALGSDALVELERRLRLGWDGCDRQRWHALGRLHQCAEQPGDAAQRVGPGFPASIADPFTSSIGGCCQYQATLARDMKTKDVWVAWSSLTTDKYGIWVQKMPPSKASPGGRRAR